MDQAVLVNKIDRDIGAQVLDALSRAKIPVNLYAWKYVPELDEWQLTIATEWVDEKGRRATYRALIDALRRTGNYERVPLRRVYLRSPADPVVKELQRQAKDQKDGFIHILRYNGEYSLVFAPVTGKGDTYRMRLFSDEDELKQFLQEDLQLRPRAIEDALDEVERTRAGSIYPVTLTSRQIKKLQLS